MKSIFQNLKLISKILSVITLVIINCLFFMEHLRLLVTLRFYIDRIDRGELAANVPLLVKLSGLNLIFAILYFIILCFDRYLTKLLANIKTNRKKYFMFYILIILLITGISIFVIYTNLQYFSHDIIISKFFESDIVYIIMCNLLGVCFCIHLWRKFFDDIVLFFKVIAKKIKRITIQTKRF